MAEIRKTLIAAALLAVLGGTVTACSDSGDGVKPKPKATVDAPSEEKAGDSEEETVDEGDDTLIVALDKPAKWRNGVTAALSKFSRGNSGDTAYPENTPYLKFTVTVTNGHKTPLDLSMITISCPEDGEEIFDSANGLDGTPSKHVLPGEKGTWTMACAFDAKQTDVQIEMTPFDSSDDDAWYRTAIFKGEVK